MNTNHPNKWGRLGRAALGLLGAAVSAAAAAAAAPSSLSGIDHFIIIYQENWSFDSLYGRFPGANGIANASAASLTQRDRITGNPISTLSAYNPVGTGKTTPAQIPPVPLNGAVDTNFLANPALPNGPLINGLNTLLPYDLNAFIPPGSFTGDIVHRYWQEQLQINRGAMDRFLTWSDNPGLVMSYYDATALPEGQLAQQYVMCDNFFHGAFGGSFLNHQFLIAAAAPVFPNAATVTPNSIATLDTSGALALNGSGQLVRDGFITPIGAPAFANPSVTFDKNYAVNTAFSVGLVPTFQNVTNASLLPLQNNSNPADPNRPYIPTIGDRLDAANISWKWYSGGYSNALDSSPSNPAHYGTNGTTVSSLFQWHHQPFAFFDNYTPWTNGVRNPVSAAHLQDEADFFNDITNGTLPAVSFVKPLGPDNEHPGYASLLQGQQHVANIVAAVQANPTLWARTAIIVTYDEHGGRWDHVAPPTRDVWGPGSRVPAIIISPKAKQGVVDHTQYETASILSTVEKRFNLAPLNAVDAAAPTLDNAFQPVVPTPVYLGVAAGDVTSTDVVLWTRVVDTNAPAEMQLLAQVSTNANFAFSVQSFPTATVAANDYTAKVVANGLKPGTRYYYRFTDGANTSLTGTFKTAPAPNAAVPVHFGFSGDLDGLMRPYAAARDFSSFNFDFFSFVGDTIYETASSGSAAAAATGTTPTPSATGATQAQLLNDYSRKYREQFLPVNSGGQPGLQNFFAAQANYTLYDNHELGNKQYINGGAPAGGPVGDMTTGAGVDARQGTNDVNTSGTYINKTPGFQILQQVFVNYQPIRERGLINTGGADPSADGTRQLYTAQQWGRNALFINTDTRTYRDIRMKTSANADDTGARADNPARTMFGATQFAWLKQTLLNAQAAGIPWKFISISDPIDQLGPIGGSLSGVSNGGNTGYSPVASDGGKAFIGGYRAERNALLKFIADNGILNVIFLTTDDHQNRVNELLYSTNGQTAVQSTYARVPYCFEIVAGPLGATGPDLITNHTFANNKLIADSLAAAQVTAGLDPIGLDPKYPGLHNVNRVGDPNADALRQPLDFYSPDTFNLSTLDVSADGRTLTVSTYGILSTPQNSFAEYNPATNGLQQILSFSVDAALPPASVTVQHGSNTVLNVTDFGPNSTYQWLKDGAPVPGATNASLALNNVRGGDLGKTGPSSTRPSVLDPVGPRWGFHALLSTGDSVNNKPNGAPYIMGGIPDGLGAFDNGDGTFTLLMNHELTSAVGLPRTHGGKGAYVSRWIIRKADLAVLNGSDLITNVFLWDGASAHTQAVNVAFSRFCSADLPAPTALFNPATGNGTTNLVFFNGEEVTGGRAFAHFVTGPLAGNSYQIPALGTLGNWENLLAHPGTGDQTLIMANQDNSAAGYIRAYLGSKTNNGSELQKAGLLGGTLYSVAVMNAATETRANNIGLPAKGASTNFTLVTTPGTAFARPEDGAWDPSNPSDYYFVTTDDMTTRGGRSRLWRLRFSDVTNNPTVGGTITMLLDGTEGQEMFDNICITRNGRIVLLEDPGNDPQVAKVWTYDIASAQFTMIGTHNTNLFTTGRPGFLTQDEETSGVIDMASILGYPSFLLTSQIHTTNGLPPGTATEAAENGQLLLMYPLADGGYSVIVSNAAGVITSAVAQVTISVPPLLAQQYLNTALGGLSVPTGGNVLLTVPASAVGGSGPFTYQWRFNGNAIAGATNAAFQLTGFNAGQVGNYDVVIGNSLGSVTNAPVPVSSADIGFFGGVILNAPVNSRFRIDYLSDVNNTNSWTTLTNLVHPGGQFIYVDTSSSGAQRRFFRAVPTP